VTGVQTCALPILLIRAAKKGAPGPLTLRVVESSANKLLVRRS